MVNQDFTLIPGQIEDSGFHDDVAVLAIGKCPHGALRGFIDGSFEWPCCAAQAMIQRTGNRPAC